MPSWLEILVALTGLGLFLDQIATNRAKIGFIRLFGGIGRNIRPAYGLENIVSRLAGERIFSVRAFVCSSFITVLSIALMVFAVFLIDGAEAKNIVSAGFYFTGFFAVQLFLITFLILIIADFLSFSQTRLFMKTVNILTQPFSTFIMLVADVISSIAIYISFMALARMVCYILIASQHQEKISLTREYIFPSVVRDVFYYGVGTDGLKDKDQFPARIKMLPISIMSDDQAKMFAREIRLGQLREDVYPNSISFMVKDTCLPLDLNNPAASYDAVYALANSVNFAIGAINDTNFRTKTGYEARRAQEIAAFSLKKSAKSGRRCNVRAIEIVSQINPFSLIGEVSITDAYLAALSMTMEETLRAVTLKFSVYDPIVPQLDIGNFLGRAVASDSIKFLGFGLRDPYMPVAAESFIRKNFSMSTEDYYFSIPNTTYSASSMMPSILFFLFILLRITSKFWYYAYETISAAYRKNILRRFVFSFSGLVIFIIYLTISLITSGLSGFWHYVIT